MVHARNIPLSMANWTRVDDQPDNAFQGHRGQQSNDCIFGPEELRRPVNPLMYAIKCNSS